MSMPCPFCDFPLTRTIDLCDHIYCLHLPGAFVPTQEQRRARMPSFFKVCWCGQLVDDATDFSDHFAHLNDPWSAPDFGCILQHYFDYAIGGKE